MNSLLFLTKLNLKRNFRSLKYLILVIFLPVALYILCLIQIGTPNKIIDHQTIGSYFLISTITFGILANSVLSFGTNLGKEKSEKWFKFLKASPISENAYSLSQVICFLFFCIITILLLFFIGIIFGKVSLNIFTWLRLFFFSLIGSFTFILLGLLLSCFKKLAQPLSALSLVFLTFLGGMWTTMNSMSSSTKFIAKLTPTYNYANLSWSLLQKKPFATNSLIILILYIILFALLYFAIAKKTDKM